MEKKNHLNRIDFRLAFTKYKQSLKHSMYNYLRSNEGDFLKPREHAYVINESQIIRAKARAKEFYEANQLSSMLDLQIYCLKQA
uniref:Uncharacterized protein n=1 Tax=Panagrolaimus davidi TaxID=227884 RepID=A0A914Q1L5_9BILA